MARKTKNQATVFLAGREANKLMSAMDMTDRGSKVFVVPVKVSYKSLNRLNEEKILRIIAKSKKANRPFWVAAIEHRGKMYKDKGIKMLSDGTHGIFI